MATTSKPKTAAPGSLRETIDAILARRPHEPVIFSVTINAKPDDVFAVYRNFEQLPVFMDYLESVTETGSNTSHWVAKLPFGGTVSWDAVITEERRGELIAWQTRGDAKFGLEGRVTFAPAPAPGMTEVRVVMKLGVGKLKPSYVLGKLFAKPQIKGDLRRLKQVIETGEVLKSDASIHKGPHPAQPSVEGGAS